MPKLRLNNQTIDFVVNSYLTIKVDYTETKSNKINAINSKIFFPKKQIL